MASGAERDVEAVSDVLGAYAKAVLRVGDAGAGQVMKLAVNLVVHSLGAAVAESLVLATRGGIAADAAYDVLQASVVGAPFVQYKRAAYVEAVQGGQPPVAMSVALTAKDLRLVGELADELGAALPVASAVAASYRAALEGGMGQSDMAALAAYLESLG
jgi:3-hydroxyisobutyrate dehydrogenase-like beta-hydroxyacid dehydrogenase